MRVAILPPERLPERIEVCARDRGGVPCLGVIYRPWPHLPYCPRCGAKEPGVVYVRAAPVLGPEGERRAA
jgi:hypothetical protein